MPVLGLMQQSMSKCIVMHPGQHRPVSPVHNTMQFDVNCCIKRTDRHPRYAKTTSSAQLYMNIELLLHSFGILVLVHLCLTD